MSKKDELEFEFTVKDLDQMVLDAAKGGEQAKPASPNILQLLRGKKEANKEPEWPLT